MSLPAAINGYFVQPILSLIIIVIFVNVILSWLLTMGIVNRHNQVVSTVWQITDSIMRPLVAPFRRFIPPMGGLDFAPLIMLLCVYFIKGYLAPLLLH